jgi:hypothetical protein
VFVKGVKECCISNAMDGTNDDSCGMAVKRMGTLGVSVKMMKAITMKMDTVTLIGEDRQNLTCFLCEINDKIYFCYYTFHFWVSS